MATGVPQPSTLPALVAMAGERYGDRPALLIRPGFRTRIWSYRDVAGEVPRVAAVLAAAGVDRGDRVVIWAVNRPEWVLAFLATAHLGAVSVPLDVRHAHDFAGRVAERTGARLVLASRQTADGARSLGLPIAWIESLPDAARRAEPRRAATVTDADLAEIVFTSGTTGEPKGAMISHGNLLASAVASASSFPIGPRERLISVLPLSHLFEQGLGLITPLLVGASIVYPVSRQPAVLLRTFRDYGVSMLLIVPQGLRLLDNAIGRQVDQAGRRAAFERLHRLARPLPARLRRILFRPVLGRLGGRLHSIGVGASALEPEVAERWQSMGVQVLQGYGATEMSPTISFTRPERNRLGTVGEPVPGVELRLLDDGEILVRGPNRFARLLAGARGDGRGHRRRRLVPHRRPRRSLDADGVLTLRGRKKDMIALPDGQKVYPEDVEAVLRLDPRVADACVVGWPQSGDLRVHAVLLLADRDQGDSGGGASGEGDAAAAIVRAANNGLGAHQQIRGQTVWPDDDLPRTHALKVKKFEVLARLSAMTAEAAAAAGSTSRASAVVGSSGPDAGARPMRPTRVTADAVSRRSGGDDRGRHRRRLAALDRAGRAPVERPRPRLAPARRAARRHRGGARGLHRRRRARTRGDRHRPRRPGRRRARRRASDGHPCAGRSARSSGPSAWSSTRSRSGPGRASTTGSRSRASSTWRTSRARSSLPPTIASTRTSRSSSASSRAHVRWKLSVAAAADDIFGNPLRGFGVSVLANAFPLAREGAVRRSLELLGTRLDRGFSILIFPEGKLTVGGPMQPLKSGVGLIAVEGALPVVPIKLDFRRLARIDAPGNPRRGEVVVRIGAPMRFDADTDPVAATADLERALGAL